MPFPYFYDVSGWSLPLLAGIQRRLDRPARARADGPRPEAAHAHHAQAVRQAAADRRAGPVQADPERLPVLRLAQVAARPGLATALQGPRSRRRSPPSHCARSTSWSSGTSTPARCTGISEPKGRAALAAWVDRGGRYVGWQEGALLASAVGISQVGMSTPRGRVARGDDADPYAARTQRDRVGQRLQPRPGSREPPGWSVPSRAACSSPGSPRRPRRSRARALETVEGLGRGSVTVFGYEPNFRAVADGSARLLRQAILRTPRGSVPSTARTPRGRTRSRRGAVGGAEPRPHAGVAPGPRQQRGTSELTCTWSVPRGPIAVDHIGAGCD